MTTALEQWLRREMSLNLPCLQHPDCNMHGFYILFAKPTSMGKQQQFLTSMKVQSRSFFSMQKDVQFLVYIKNICIFDRAASSTFTMECPELSLLKLKATVKILFQMPQKEHQEFCNNTSHIHFRKMQARLNVQRGRINIKSQ